MGRLHVHGITKIWENSVKKRGYEILNSELSISPDIEKYKSWHKNTHFDFHAGHNADGYYVIARPHVNQ
jgi:hypothetical protein